MPGTRPDVDMTATSLAVRDRPDRRHDREVVGVPAKQWWTAEGRGRMPRVSDEEFRDPRLARLYDALDSDRSDLTAYLALAEELRARRVLDVGCGTGTFALLLAERGYDVIGVDPATASVQVARGKPGAQLVQWLVGDATSVQVDDRDLVTMTANTAQLITEPEAWAATLRACRAALVPGGYLVFEARRPSARAWEGWTVQLTGRTTQVEGVGAVHSQVETVEVEEGLVTFRWIYVLPNAGQGSVTATSTSTLRFREQAELEGDVRRAGLTLVDVRQAPDRPGQEFVVIARNGPDSDSARTAP